MLALVWVMDVRICRNANPMSDIQRADSVLRTELAFFIFVRLVVNAPQSWSYASNKTIVKEMTQVPLQAALVRYTGYK